MGRHLLGLDQIAREFRLCPGRPRMAQLREIAVELGPYDVATCNCHHCALAVFEAAAEASSVPRIPNAWLVAGVKILRDSAGFDISASRSVGQPGSLSCFPRGACALPDKIDSFESEHVRKCGHC